MLAVLKNRKMSKGNRGKASAPPDPLSKKDEDPFITATPSSVAMEATDDVDMDVNVKTGSAYLAVVEALEKEVDDSTDGAKDSDVGATEMALLSGTARSQFEATFFLAAYSYLARQPSP